MRVGHFGNWGVGLSDDEAYPFALSDGPGSPESENLNFGLNLCSELSPYWHLAIQASLVVERGAGDAELDFAYLTWRLRDALQLHGGKIRMPIGVYAEVFDIGTLRPFYTLPQSVYGPTDLVAESMVGVGISGDTMLKQDWDVVYDLFYGDLKLEEGVIFRYLEGENPREEQPDVTEQSIEHALGGRVVFIHRENGLRLGFSAYTGDAEAGPAEIPGSWGDRRSWILHGQWEAHRWQATSEIGWHEDLGEVGYRGAYAEVAYRLSPLWQLALRGELGDASGPNADFLEDSGLGSFTEHREWAVGVNAWVNPSMVFKLSHHRIRGNLLYHPKPQEILAVVDQGILESSTEQTIFGIQYSF
ncbi:MAG: hypothetical protein AAGD01_14300 [Acidobacteriota bacterium]